MPNNSRNTGRKAIFGTAKRNETSGSKKLRTARARPAASPAIMPAAVPMTKPPMTRKRLAITARRSSPSAVTSHSAASIVEG